MLMSLFLWAATPSAFALGGSFVGPLGKVPPPSSATQVVVARQGDRAIVTVSAQAAEDMEGVAWIWPAPGLVSKSIRLPELDGLTELESFTRPRVQRVHCEELVDTLRYRTPPGCASYEVPVVDEPLQGSDAVGDVGIPGDFAGSDPEVSLLTLAQLDAWLDEHGLGITANVREGLEPWLVEGTPLVAVFHAGTLARGAWMRPVRFEMDATAQPASGVALPLSGWAAEANTAHELTVLSIDDRTQANAGLSNMPTEGVEQDCLLPATEATAFWEEAVERMRARQVLPWVPVHASSAAACAPCTHPPLSPAALADLGVSGTPLDQLRVSRMYVRYIPGQLTLDPVVDYEGEASDHAIVWIDDDPGLGFAWPECDGDLDPNDVCPTITPSTSGCDAGGAGARLGWVAAMALLLTVARRRPTMAAALVLATLVTAPTAHAADRPTAKPTPADRTPRWEVAASVGLLGTNRVVTSAAPGGAPGASAPFLGIGGRYALVGWRHGANLGLVAAVRGWAGDAAPGVTDSPVRFTLLEPSVGVDIRHGRWRDQLVSPLFRYGVGLAIPWLDPSASASQSSLSALVELGVGGWVKGTKAVRPLVELRLTILPRTDGFVTDYHPVLQYPSFTFFPGTANLQLRVGASFR